MAYRRLHTLTDLTTGLSGERMALLLALSGIALLAAVVFPLGVFKSLLAGASVGLFWIVALTAGQEVIARFRNRALSKDELSRLQGEPLPAVLTNDAGVALAGNNSAAAFSGWSVGASIADGLQSLVAEPGVTLSQLSRVARDSGSSSQTVGAGDTSAQIRVSRLGRNRLLWSLSETVLDPDLAVIVAGREGLVMNPAADSLLGSGPKTLSDVVLDMPIRNLGVHRIRTTKGEVRARICELSNTANGSEIALIPIADDRSDHERPNPVVVEADLLSALPVPMLKIAEDGTLLQINSEARSILSLPESAPMPPLFELVEGMGRPIAEWLADACKGRGLLRPEIVRAVAPGQELFLQITLGRTMEAGRIVLVGILNDATELKTLEAQFVQSQKMQAIGQLAGGVAHDFNNLLTAISGHCDLLLLRHDAGDPEYADLIQISQNSNRAASLVGQLLAFSRKQNLKPQSLDLSDTMLDIAHLLNRLIGERIQLDVTHAPGPQMIRADRRQLEQVIVNLVVNARDAMPNGGTIQVQTRTEFLAEEVLRDRARLTPGEYVVIEVQDTGIGIPQDGISKIFEPFYSTKKTSEGTGLGLSTAYGIVKQTGGFIFVESTPGEGTVFSLYFPACSDPVPSPAPDEPVGAASTQTRGEGVILLVEDEAPVRAFASRALRLRGYTVIEAEHAEAALAILEDKALTFDIFVTDVVMPGMDGPTWVRKALEDRPDTRVVFMSGYAEESSAEKQSRIPNSVFLPKPFSLHQLTALVQEQLQ